MGALSLVGGPGERGAGRVALGEQARAGRGKKAGPRWAVREGKKGGGLGRVGAWAEGLVSSFGFFSFFSSLSNSNSNSS